jgi:hypothetical protein
MLGDFDFGRNFFQARGFKQGRSRGDHAMEFRPRRTVKLIIHPRTYSSKPI